MYLVKDLKRLKNNEIENLIPLCPTHHQYMHSRHKDEIQHIINEYVEKRKLCVAQSSQSTPLGREKPLERSQPHRNYRGLV